MNTTMFFDTAWGIGMELVRDAIWDGDRCTWQGASMESVEGKYIATVRTFKSDLYSGTSGIAFFLSALHSVKKNDLLRKTIEGAVAHSLSMYGQAQDNGFYSGKTGIAFAIIESGKRMHREDWINKGISILSAIEPKAAQNHETDIISGVAGTIHGMLYGYAHNKDAALLEKAGRLGDILISLAEKSNNGWGWTSIPGKPTLTGISHGLAGISCALLELYKATQKQQYYDAAMEGIKSEQIVFHPGYGNWPDFREGIPTDPAKMIYGVGWCTGAPGIALARQRSAEITGNAALQEHAEQAFNTTFNQVMFELGAGGQTSNFSVCHGIGGNADILIDSPHVRHKNAAIATGVRGIENYFNPGMPWPSGVLNQQKAPGLMLGIAGTGYFYLRLFDNSFKTILLAPQYC